LIHFFKLALVQVALSFIFQLQAVLDGTMALRLQTVFFDRR
jgi:hypothetical protein